MRIRKRQVPFPLSSLSPIPLSDLHLNPSSVPQPVQHHHHHHHVHLQPSDRPNQRPLVPIGNNRSDNFSTPDSDDGPHDDGDVEKNKACLELMMMRNHEEDKRERGEEKKSNDTKNCSILGGAQTSIGILPLSTSSPPVGGWCEGERAFPLKKRRGSLGSRLSNEGSIVREKGKKVVMKTKVNKKCVPRNDNGKNQERETNEAGNDISSKNNIGAKKKAIVRGGGIMEGSRCSRVNGRGWRCCQQTLVGYSLCEHHLGKGRLRSMTSVRNRAIANTTTSTTTAPLNKNLGALEKLSSTPKLLNSDDYYYSDDEEEEDDDEKKPLMVTKKRMKLGMVKARSLSSLLGQTDNAVVSVADNNKNNND